MKDTGAGPTPQAVWTLGLLLILADAAVSPYWHGVWTAVMQPIGADTTTASSGETVTDKLGASSGGTAASGTGDYTGLWQTGGLFLLVLLLAALAGASTDGAIIATTILLGLWLLFLLHHGQSVSGLLKRLS